MLSPSAVIFLVSLEMGICEDCRRSNISTLRYLAATWNMFSFFWFTCSMACGYTSRMASTISKIPFLVAAISGVSYQKLDSEAMLVREDWSASSSLTTSYVSPFSSIVRWIFSSGAPPEFPPIHDRSFSTRILISSSPLLCFFFVSHSVPMTNSTFRCQ